MGRRRRKYRKPQLLRPPRRLPTVFECPNCGSRMLTVDINKKARDESGNVLATIRCGKCGLYAEMHVPEIYHPVDVYSKFLDAFIEGKAEYTFKKEAAEISVSALLGEAEAGEAGESGEGAEEEG